MQILERMEDVEAWLPSVLNEPTWFVLPIFKDVYLHPAVNTLSLLYVATSPQNDFLLTFDKSDALPLPAHALTMLMKFKGNIFTPFKKDLLHLGFPPSARNIFDIASMEYLQKGKVTKLEDHFSFPMRNLLERVEAHQEKDGMDTIPIFFFGNFCRSYFKTVDGLEFRSAPLDELNFKIIPALYYMEKSGMAVDQQLFMQKYGTIQERHIVNGLVRTQYNPYTTTGRITSKFARVNYVALNKKDGTRKAFISRHGQDGRLVLIDFESFHLRLMADAMNFPLPPEPVHEYLAKQYFESDTFSPEEYEKGKQITFQLLYGDNRAEEIDIPFIQSIYKWQDTLWETFKRDGQIVSPKGRIISNNHIEDPTPAKLFNYFLQLREMEVGIDSISQALELLNKEKHHIILYTYDSVLIDCDLRSPSQIIYELPKVISQDGKFPVRLYAGLNYDVLRRINV